MSLSDNDWYSALTTPTVDSRCLQLMLLGGWTGLYCARSSTLHLAHILQDSRHCGLDSSVTGLLVMYTPDHDGISVVVDDIAFGILGVVLVAVGHLGMNKAVEGGTMIQRSRVYQTACLACFPENTESGKTVADWMIVFAIIFYLAWSAQFLQYMGRPRGIRCQRNSVHVRVPV